MKKAHLVAGLLVSAVLFLPTSSMAIPISSTDLWDISQGSTVDSTSGALNYSSFWNSDVRNMFGSAFGTVEAGNTLFKDFMSPGQAGGSVPAGFTHFVEWHTPGLVTLRSFDLHASNEGMTRRAFNRFQLFSGDGAGNWSSIYDTGAGFSYGVLDLAIDVAPVTAQYFRAEFVQAPWTDSRAIGPRIHELDGFDTFLDGTTGGSSAPEPSTVFLMGLGLAALGFGRRRKA